MLTAARIAEEVGRYRQRLDELYQNVRSWTTARRPDAGFSQAQIELTEETTGTYHVQSLNASIPGLPVVRFDPRGIFMVGARGRVDVRSQLGREILVWVEAGGPVLQVAESSRQEPEATIGHPLFRNVSQGWAWSDSRHRQLLPLDDHVLWERVLNPLTR